MTLMSFLNMPNIIIKTDQLILLNISLFFVNNTYYSIVKAGNSDQIRSFRLKN